MENKTLGFIGAGRVTKILLQSFKNLNISFKQIMVIDTNRDVLEQLSNDFPEINATLDDLRGVVDKDIVFIALHPPVIMEILEEIRHFLNENTILVSLAPKITIEKIVQKLGGHNQIARFIPNAPSVINEGYNPVCFSYSLSDGDKQNLTGIFEKSGKCIVVEEKKLEKKNLFYK